MLISILFTYDTLPAVRQGCNVCCLIIIKQVLEQLMLIQRFRKFMPGLLCQHKAYWLAQLREFYLQV